MQLLVFSMKSFSKNNNNSFTHFSEPRSYCTVLSIKYSSFVKDDDLTARILTRTADNNIVTRFDKGKMRVRCDTRHTSSYIKWKGAPRCTVV